MAAFVTKETGTISAKLMGQNASINMAGINPDVSTQEDAKEQMDKILAIADKAVNTNKMTITIVKEGET